MKEKADLQNNRQTCSCPNSHVLRVCDLDEKVRMGKPNMNQGDELKSKGEETVCLFQWNISVKNCSLHELLMLL